MFSQRLCVECLSGGSENSLHEVASLTSKRKTPRPALRGEVAASLWTWRVRGLHNDCHNQRNFKMRVRVPSEGLTKRPKPSLHPPTRFRERSLSAAVERGFRFACQACVRIALGERG